MPLPLISARLPSALRSSMAKRRRPSSPVVGRDPDEPVGADAPVAVAHARRRCPRRSAGRRRRSSRTRKSLPRPWCLVRRMRWSFCRAIECMPHAVDVRRAGRRPRRPSGCGGRGGTSAPGGGRSGGCGATARSTASSRRARRPGGGRAARGSRGPGGPCGTGPPGGSTSGATSSRKPASSWSLVAGRDALVELGPVPAQADEAERRRRVGRRGRGRRTRTAGRCRASPRGPARPGGGCVGSMRAAATGSSVGEPGVQRAPVSGSASSSARTVGELARAASRSSTTARR